MRNKRTACLKSCRAENSWSGGAGGGGGARLAVRQSEGAQGSVAQI